MLSKTYQSMFILPIIFVALILKWYYIIGLSFAVATSGFLPLPEHNIYSAASEHWPLPVACQGCQFWLLLHTYNAPSTIPSAFYWLTHLIFTTILQCWFYKWGNWDPGRSVTNC